MTVRWNKWLGVSIVLFEVVLTARAKRDLRALAGPLQAHAATILRGLQLGEPTLRRKKLSGRLEHSARSGSVRVIYQLEGRKITVTRIGDRRDVYR